MKQALHIFAFNEYHNHTDNSEDFYEAILNLKNQRERAKKLGFQLDNTLSTNKVKKI